jgi:hypothetical protein
MRRVLNSSDQIAITDENHFLGHLLPWEGVRQKFRKLGDLSCDDNVRRLVHYVYSGRLEKSFKRFRYWSYHWKWIIETIDREEFLKRILDSDRSERALFTIMMQVYADHFGAPVTGEKTPAHLRYVPTLMEWFPNGKVIHMLRDPRAIFVSELRRRKADPISFPFKQLKHVGPLFKFYIVLQTTVAWMESALRCSVYERRYPDRYRILQFEHLVSQPGERIKQLCDFLEIDFQEQMLGQRVVSEGFQLGKTGFDAETATRWQEHIDSWIDTWFLFWFQKHLRNFGYIGCSE